MKIDNLFDLFDSNKIEDKFDKLIAEKILEAEKKWKEPIDNLSEFIDILEKEIGNETTKENLEILLEKYTKNGFEKSTWNSESILYLLDIFKWTGFSNLKLVFENLTKKLVTIEKTTKIELFEKKGFPTIKLYEDYFEIKAIDYWEFRSFYFSEIKELSLINIKAKWWYQLYINSSFIGRIFSKNDPIKLKVLKQNGAYWEYQVPNIHNSEFNMIIKKINSKSKNTIANNVYT